MTDESPTTSAGDDRPPAVPVVPQAPGGPTFRGDVEQVDEPGDAETTSAGAAADATSAVGPMSLFPPANADVPAKATEPRAEPATSGPGSVADVPAEAPKPPAEPASASPPPPGDAPARVASAAPASPRFPGGPVTSPRLDNAPTDVPASEVSSTDGPAMPPMDPLPADPGAGERRPADAGAPAVTSTAPVEAPRPGRPRARKVRRVIRHVEPWSVLKISLLFYLALFLIVCVASGILWGAARAAGTVDNVESFITSVGGFGNCEPVDGAAPVTDSTLPGAIATNPVDQLDAPGSATSLPDAGVSGTASLSDESDCREGEALVGEFRFEDVRIFEAFVLGGIVLVLAGSAANVVMVLLFNLMSDLTGGVRVTVLEEDTPLRARPTSGSPATRPRD